MPRKKKKNIVLEKLLIENFAAEGKSLVRRDGTGRCGGCTAAKK
jgi:hypothetical protein